MLLSISFKLHYPHLTPTTVLAGLQDRVKNTFSASCVTDLFLIIILLKVVESAQWFSQGLWGRGWSAIESSAFFTIPEDLVTISWITPMDTCANWSYAYGGNVRMYMFFIPSLSDRVNAGSRYMGNCISSSYYQTSEQACPRCELYGRGYPWCSLCLRVRLRRLYRVSVVRRVYD